MQHESVELFEFAMREERIFWQADLGEKVM
jgi:hypothetical protein